MNETSERPARLTKANCKYSVMQLVPTFGDCSKVTPSNATTTSMVSRVLMQNSIGSHEASLIRIVVRGKRKDSGNCNQLTTIAGSWSRRSSRRIN